jgi:hypothetical protein
MSRTYSSQSPRPLADRLWARVDKNGPVPLHRPDLGPCWIWTGATNGNDGRGVIFRGRGEGLILVPRAAFLIAHGRLPLPEKPFALHHCDNPPCAKSIDDEHGAAHIYEGTDLDNVRDTLARGRAYHQNLTHCPKGHLYDAANTQWVNGAHGRQRACRACASAGAAARHASRRAANLCVRCSKPSPIFVRCEECLDHIKRTRKDH